MQHTNQLIHSLSPYLQQHAHNPVNWLMWSDETLQKAQQENKPILVSIGYSSCHWCHVMERESFEDEKTAAIMNEHFINIKIDREERPDLDHIYMDAVQAMTGSGGWPLNVFLTPNLKPFYGGTYFPPIAAYGRMSWTETLIAVSKSFNGKKQEIEMQAEKLTEHLNRSNQFAKNTSSGSSSFNDETLDIIAQNLLKNADKNWGGFGNAPKFPQTFSIQYLLRHYHFTKDENALQQALLSLDKMILGGIYDQIAGGFSRYSVDEKWFAPHFEKMLYDNALLINVLSEAYQLTKKNLYKETIEQTLAFIEREMMSEEFAFYSALDADSEGVEGKFYTWSKQEIENILLEDAALFCEIYQVEEIGNWEHTNILWLDKTIENIAVEKNIAVIVLKEKIERCKQLLLKKRAERIRPLLDDKTLCSWNALINIAYCKAYAATGVSHYKNIAEKNIDFVLTKMMDKEQLFHCYKNNIAYNIAFLDDYAYLIWALIHLQEITGNLNYLFKAKELLLFVEANFSDNENLFFNYTVTNQKDIIAQKIEVYDGATPSANAVLGHCLQYLSIVFNDDKIRKRFLAMISCLEQAIIKYPNSFCVWAILLQNNIKSLKEIVVSGSQANAAALHIIEVYQPNKVVVYWHNDNQKDLPILFGKKSTEDLTIYLCQNQTCLPSFSSIENFLVFYNI
ncbi:MAG: thioredoxin domain-containing protein [Bacteroidetes bacterium]|nr:thioredoxin domain-containing protein [Bacteroidota bacterium]